MRISDWSSDLCSSDLCGDRCLIFCFFAEDTDIFHRSYPFTGTVETMSERDSSNTHEVIGEIFRAMNTAIKDRARAALPRWADAFHYVTGGLFRSEARRVGKGCVSRCEFRWAQD